MSSTLIQEIADKWNKDEKSYLELGEIVHAYIDSEISNYEIRPQTSFRTKDLLSIIKKVKKKQRSKTYDYDSLNDKLGIRIICTFIEEMKIVDEFMKKSFSIVSVEYKKDGLDFDKLSYISNHYDARLNLDIEKFKKYKQFENLVFEVQVRTLNQHAWSNAAHSLSYKQEANISPQLMRRIYRLLSLYEIADDEFSAVNNALLAEADNEVYSLLRQLEGKIYKFAKVDFDRETSLYALKILLNFFTSEERIEVQKGIVPFITENESKIESIFAENRTRFYEIPFLTQPEIFLIWYGIEKYFFSIDDSWDNHFDRTELDQIKAVWGKTIE